MPVNGKISSRFDLGINELFGEYSAWRCHTASKASWKRTRQGRFKADLFTTRRPVLYNGACEEVCSCLNAFTHTLTRTSTTIDGKDFAWPKGLPPDLIEFVNNVITGPNTTTHVDREGSKSDSELVRSSREVKSHKRHRRHSLDSKTRDNYIATKYKPNPRHIPKEAYYQADSLQPKRTYNILNNESPDPSYQAERNSQLSYLKAPIFGTPSVSALNCSIAEFGQSRESIFDDSISDFDNNLQAGHPIPGSSGSSFEDDFLQDFDTESGLGSSSKSSNSCDEEGEDAKSLNPGQKSTPQIEVKRPQAITTKEPSGFIEIDVYLPPYYCDRGGPSNGGGRSGPGGVGSIICKFTVRVTSGTSVRTLLSAFRSDLTQLANPNNQLKKSRWNLDVCLQCAWDLYPVVQDSISVAPGQGSRATRMINRPDQSKSPFDLNSKIEQLGVNEVAILVLDSLNEDLSKDSHKSLGLDMARFIVDYRNMMHRNNSNNDDVEKEEDSILAEGHTAHVQESLIT